MEEYQELANAIVAQAGLDYMQALDILRQCPDARDAQRTVRRIERFMRSAWFGMLTKADPEYLIRKMRQAAAECEQGKEWIPEKRRKEE